MFEYKILSTDGLARAGELLTPHGVIETPVFMPVGTHGAVKGVSPSELTKVGSQIILGNTYHLYLRPGEEIVSQAGDLHGFMNWNKPILTDSGGFQVFSLGERGDKENKKAMCVVAEEGITFKSHLDGSKHLFTPEKSIQIQQKLGADIIMAFDQPVYGLSSHFESKVAMQRSMRWLERSNSQWQKGVEGKQALFGIVQGGIHTDLHIESAEKVSSMNLPGNAIGGLSVGEDKKVMWEAVSSINSHLPVSKPRYFMGLGDPTDIIEASIRGVDMYDCVAPSRLARHGVIWNLVCSDDLRAAFWAGETEKMLDIFKMSKEGVSFNRLNLLNSKYQTDFRTFDTTFGIADGFTFSALSHYVKEGEMLGFRILTLHNIGLLHQITKHMRWAILNQKMGLFCELFRVSQII